MTAPRAYYSEWDKHAAAWLRELIKRGLIAHGDVDERSITDVSASDLRGYTQCHFFAGLGAWSHSLRLAGWPDDRPVWTGSCPCQPFSAAGRGEGVEDARHLWPAFFRLIRECRPESVFGEQVSGKDGLAWLDHVALDLEAESYTIGALSAPACSVGAPHKRERLYWCAVAESGSAGTRGDTRTTSGPQEGLRGAGDSDGVKGCYASVADGPACELADSERNGTGQASTEAEPGSDRQDYRLSGGSGAHLRETACGLADADRGRLQQCDTGQWAISKPDAQRDAGLLGDAELHGLPAQQQFGGTPEEGRVRQSERPGPTNGFWADAEWIACRDGKARATGPGISPLVVGNAKHPIPPWGEQGECSTEDGRREADGHNPSSATYLWQGSTESRPIPLAHGSAARVGSCGDSGPSAAEVLNTSEARVMRLRGYGNCIAAPQAAEFIRAFLDVTGGGHV